MATQNNINNVLASNGLVATGGRTIGTIEIVNGDLMAGNGVNSSALLTPGSDYQSLIADSAASTGLSFADGLTTSNNNNRTFGYGNSVSNFTWGAMAAPIMSTAALVANRLYFIPFVIYESTTFTKIGVSVTTLAASTGIRLGIYNYNNTYGYPGSLILDAGTIDSSTTGDKTISISQTLYDKFWLCLISNGTPSIRTSYTVAPPLSEVNAWWGMNSFGSPSNNSSPIVSSAPSYYTALPATFTGTSVSVTFSRTSAYFLTYLQV